MEYQPIPEINGLLAAVEKKFGHTVACTNDFNALAAIIKFEGKELISASTLKRLWGYVSLQTTPRKTTLDILSRFVGYQDFNQWRISQYGKTTDSSAFIDSYYLDASDVEEGGIISIGWDPDRIVKLKKIGENHFEVVENVNSKLRVGDKLMCSCFFKGLPLAVPTVERDNQMLPAYVAGKKNGLNLVKVEA